MNWFIPSLGALLLWGTYQIPCTTAGSIHGEKVNMAFETVGFILLTVIALVSSNAWSDFHKITGKSAVNGAIFALMSAGGFYLMLYALRVAPAKLPIISLISGMFPFVLVIATSFQGTRYTPVQWLGVALGVVALTLVNLKI